MKYPNNKQTELYGVNAVRTVVNEQGSIFREIHQENDIGIDGILEVVKDQKSEGLLVAVQIKSGESYVRTDRFVVAVDQDHLDYWREFMLPVVMICYSPRADLLGWVSVNRYVERHLKNNDEPPKLIEIPFKSVFDRGVVERDLYGIALERQDERILFRSADMILSDNVPNRLQGLSILRSHPASRSTRLLVNLASSMILDESIDNVRVAVQAIGAVIEPTKWAWSYSDPNWDVAFYAQRCCFKFDGRHIRKMMEAIDDGFFGRASLGEACIDCIKFIPNGESLTWEIVFDTTADPKTRLNALALFYAGDWWALRADAPSLRAVGLGELIDWLLEHSE